MTHAHRWVIESPHDGEPYVWGRCATCPRRRAFRTGWPTRYNKEAERKQRVAFERKERRKERRKSVAK